MGWFDREPAEEQLQVYSGLLEEKQGRYEELEGVQTGNSILEREQLQEEMANIQIQIEQTRDMIEISQDQSEGQSLNDYND